MPCELGPKAFRLGKEVEMKHSERFASFFRIALKLSGILLLLCTFVIPLPAPVQASQTLEADNPCRTFHIVVRGETITMIARRYGVTVQDLEDVNDLQGAYRLHAGDILCIPWSGGTSRGNLNASISSSKRTIRIWGTGFRRNHDFFVKVRARQGDTWKRLGTVRPNNDGNFQKSFRLPANMSKIRSLEVCLKEIYRDYLVCTRAQVY
jgi:hypothetical protein